MRHVIMTCKNHLSLRWSCKDIAWSGFYNGSRNIFFNGEVKLKEDGTPKMFSDGSGVETTYKLECQCPASDLILAEEDTQVKRH